MCVCVFSQKSERSGVGQTKVMRERGSSATLREVNTIALVVILVRVKVDISQTG